MSEIATSAAIATAVAAAAAATESVTQKSSLNININNAGGVSGTTFSGTSGMKADFTPKIIRNGAATVRNSPTRVTTTTLTTSGQPTTVRKYHLPPPPVVSSALASASNSDNSYAIRRVQPNTQTSIYQPKYLHDDKLTSSLNGERNKKQIFFFITFNLVF